jgi:hypothetical protein
MEKPAKNKEHKFTWARLRHLLNSMEDEDLNTEVLLLDGFSHRLIRVDSIGSISEYSNRVVSEGIVLFGKARKE